MIEMHLDITYIFPIALLHYGENYIKIHREGHLFLSTLIFPQISLALARFAIRPVYSRHCEDPSARKTLMPRGNLKESCDNCFQ